MNASILGYALQILSAIPMLISAGKEVMGIVNQGTAAMQKMQAENRGPTAEEWAELDAIIEGLRGELHK